VNADGTIRATSGVWKSVNGGANWTQVLAGKRVQAVRPEASGRVIVMLNRDPSQPAVLATTDGGTTWQPFNTGITYNDGIAISRTVSELGSRVVLASMTDGIYVQDKPLVSVTTVGGGSVASSVGGFSCRGSCSKRYFYGETVTLNPTTDAGSVFTGWSGACAGAGSCVLAIDGAKTVTATFTTAAGALSPNPTSLDFGGQSMNTTAPARAVTITNNGGSSAVVSSVTVSTYFAVTHNCATLAPAASCTANVTFTPTAQGSLNGTLTITSGAGVQTVSLAGIGERSLVTHYYRSVLRRAPDGPGKAFWESEAPRMQALGANVNETWFAMATAFFFSAEYLAFNRNDAEFVTDLYNTFFNRPPDAPGIAFWTGQMAAGMPREVVLVSYMFSAEFTAFTQAIFGNTQARKEVDTVVDFYRGMLSRLPDTGGFNFWVGQFRTAQCAGSTAVIAAVESISSQFGNSGEYLGRARTNAQYVGDLYNAFLRRGGDNGGVQFWISQIATGARTRENVRQQFLASAEFQGRVAGIIAQGCYTGP
jgi:hypothetical protein